jgi:hypothetical protein
MCVLDVNPTVSHCLLIYKLFILHLNVRQSSRPLDDFIDVAFLTCIQSNLS